MIVTPVTNDAPYPVNAKLTTNGGRLLVQFAGSAWRSGGGKVSVNLLLDGNSIATASVYTNEGSSHKALVPVSVLVTAAAGEHTFSVAPSDSNTKLDTNDFFSILVIESQPDF